MVANAVALLLGVLALGQQVVLAKKFKFNFDNNVTQCEPVSISFRGSEVPADSIPVTLTILPLSAPPIAIDIPNAAINSSGVYVTFFPLPAGTQFLASLDDADGQNSARVSDLFRVLDSDDASCLPPVESTTSSSLFSISENIEQCNNFTVQYNTTTAPSIRLLEPKGQSFLLPLQSDDTELKTASYLMNFSRQHDVVLMLDSGTNQKNTTSLLHIAGDASTSEACLQKNNGNNDDNGAQAASTVGAVGTLSTGAIIGVSVGGGLVVLISVLVVLFILRERKRKLRAVGSNVAFDPNLLASHRSYGSMEKVIAGEGFAPVVPPTVPQYPEGYVRDPPYAMAKYSPTESNFTRGSIASWGNAAPASRPARQSTATKRSTSSDIAPLNIEDMLNFAANRTSSQRTPDARSSFGHLVNPRPVPARAYMRPDADVPEDPTSIAMSFYPSGLLRASSTNTTHLSHAASSIWGVLPPPPAASGLPSSPRDTLNRHPPSLSGVSADGFLRPDAYTQTGSARDSVSSWGNDRGIAR